MPEMKELLRELEELAAEIHIILHNEQFDSYRQFATVARQRCEENVPEKCLHRATEELFVDFSDAINAFVERYHEWLAGQLYIRALLTKGRVMSELFVDDHTTIEEEAAESAVFSAYLKEAGELPFCGSKTFENGDASLTEDQRRKLCIYIAVLNAISKTHMDPDSQAQTEEYLIYSMNGMGVKLPGIEVEKGTL